MTAFTLLWQQQLPLAPAGAIRQTKTHFVVATKQILYGFRPADGFQEWQYPLPDDTIAWFRPAGERLVLTINPQSWAAQPPEVRILNTASLGRTERRWVPAGASQLSAPAVSGNFVFVVADNEILYWLDMMTGTFNSLPLSRPVTTAAPLVTPQLIYLTGRGNHLLTIRRNDGFQWLFEANDIGTILTHTPVSVEPYLLAANLDGQLLALQKDQLLWQQRLGRKISRPAAHANWVCVGSDKGVYGLELVTGKMAWHFPTNRPVMARPVIRDNTVYAAGYDHFLYVLDLDSGRELGHYGPTPRRLESPPLLSYPLLTLLDAGGNLFTLQLSA